MTDRDTLPGQFFEHLTPKQAAMIDILLDAKAAADDPDGEWVRGVDIRERTRREYGLEVANHPGGTSGLLAGFTRRYTEAFRREVVDGRWFDDSRIHAQFRVGDKYEQELRDQRHRLPV